MAKRIIIFLFVVILPILTYAKWKIGVGGGYVINTFSSNEYYLTDMCNHGEVGGTLGLIGQYNIKRWNWCNAMIAITTELNWMTKNHSLKRDYGVDVYIKRETQYREYNQYLQIPVMAFYSMGWKKLQGFVKIGGYTGYWLCSEGKIIHGSHGRILGVDYTRRTFSDNTDQRFDLGFCGGIGVECFPFSVKSGFLPNLSFQAEVRYYYSMRTTLKYDDLFKTPSYNRPVVLMASICYNF